MGYRGLVGLQEMKEGMEAAEGAGRNTVGGL